MITGLDPNQSGMNVNHWVETKRNAIFSANQLLLFQVYHLNGSKYEIMTENKVQR